MRLVFLIPILFLITLSAFAVDEKDCGSVRLDQNGGPFAEMPVYDQRAFADKADTQICFAISAAELADAYRFHQEGMLPAQLSAPVSIALGTKLKALGWNDIEILPKERAEDMLGSADLRDALRYLRYAKVCDQKWLNRFEGSLSGKEKLPANLPPELARLYPSKRNFLRAITEEVYRLRAKPLPFLAGIPALSGIFGEKPKAEITEDFFACRIEENVIPAKDILAAITAAAVNATPLSQMDSFLKSLCEKHSLQPKVPEPQEFNRAEQPRRGDLDMEASRTLDMELKAHALLDSRPGNPVAATFCSGILQQRDAGAINDDRLGNFHTGGCVYHSAVIIGRRFNRGRNACEFLVRDSYGTSCENESGKPRHGWPCEQGNVWVDAKQLMKATARLTWL